MSAFRGALFPRKRNPDLCVLALGSPLSRGTSGREHLQHASSFSRGKMPSEVCEFLPLTKEGAERRQALGCSGTLRGRVTYARRRLRGALHPITRDARLSALHRGICGSGPALTFKPFDLSVMRAPRVRSWWRRARFPEPPGSLLASSKRAGRRIPFCPCDASRRAPQANGTTER